MYREFVLTALWGLLLLGLAACVGAEARRLTTPLPDQRSEPWQQVTKAVQGALGVASETVLPAARRAGSEALVLIRAGHEGGELHPREVDLLRVIAERETARAWGVATLGADVRQRLLANAGLGGREEKAFGGARRNALLAQVERRSTLIEGTSTPVVVFVSLYSHWLDREFARLSGEVHVEAFDPATREVLSRTRAEFTAHVGLPPASEYRISVVRSTSE